MLKSFFQTGFVVRDIEESVRFYSEVLGMRIAGRTEKQGEFVEQVLAFPGPYIMGGFVDMGEGHQLELIQYLSPASGPNTVNRNDLGAAHLAFFVDDVDKFYQDNRREGPGLQQSSSPDVRRGWQAYAQGLLRQGPRRQLPGVRGIVLRSDLYLENDFSNQESHPCC